MLPDFIVIGAMKAGTSTLYHYLNKHPHIFLCTPKEPHFFSENWHRGVSWYERFFADAAITGATAIGEASTTYTRYPSITAVPERIASLIPRVKLIYLLRNPFQRMVSNYQHMYYARKTNKPFRSVFQLQSNLIYQSQYCTQTRQFLKHFSRENLLILSLDDLAENPTAVVDKVLTFLELPPALMPPIVETVHNRSAEKMKIGRRINKILNLHLTKTILQSLPPALKKPLKPLIIKKIDPTMLILEPDQTRAACSLFIEELYELSKLVALDFSDWIKDLETRKQNCS